mmetsp:Transcript_10521/g.20200  ORF Transcript_10521/g.20200 Transcript_10521/m.20200 type:complete len:201 (-) Transcript_10521:311-913(-)
MEFWLSSSYFFSNPPPWILHPQAARGYPTCVPHPPPPHFCGHHHPLRVLSVFPHRGFEQHEPSLEDAILCCCSVCSQKPSHAVSFPIYFLPSAEIELSLPQHSLCWTSPLFLDLQKSALSGLVPSLSPSPWLSLGRHWSRTRMSPRGAGSTSKMPSMADSLRTYKFSVLTNQKISAQGSHRRRHPILLFRLQKGREYDGD